MSDRFWPQTQRPVAEVKRFNVVFAALREFYNDTQIVELTSAIAWENDRARFDHALGVEAEGFSEGAYCSMPVV